MEQERDEVRDRDDPRGSEQPGEHGAEGPGEPPVESTASEPLESDLAQQLELKNHECAESKDKFLRLYAEFENYKKRAQRDQLDHARYAAEKVLKDVLPISDNLERAIGHARQPNSDSTILDGLDLIAKQFQEALQKSGVEPINAIGQPFDPALHHALAQVESTEHDPDTVVEEAQRGYLLHGRMLRPSLVTISKKPPTP